MKFLELTGCGPLGGAGVMAEGDLENAPGVCPACGAPLDPGASPGESSAYHSAVLAEDVYALAAAANVSRFHLVGHDHGALLGWRIAAQRPAKILSYTALSVPHVDAFSQALVGGNSTARDKSNATTADLDQLESKHRRRPLFPFEDAAVWDGELILGAGSAP